MVQNFLICQWRVFFSLKELTCINTGGVRMLGVILLSESTYDIFLKSLCLISVPNFSAILLTGDF